jgi:hypothetical protein
LLSPFYSCAVIIQSNIAISIIYQTWPLWSYGSWFHKYLCNQCLSPLMLWVRTPFMGRCTWYNILWSSLSVTCDMSMVFSTNKTDHHNLAEILLKEVLSTIHHNLICPFFHYVISQWLLHSQSKQSSDPLMFPSSSK